MDRTPEKSIERHNTTINRYREIWSRKPQLQEIYRGFYRQIAAQLVPGMAGLIVEIGSGMGKIKEVIPQCLTTDIFPNPWLDRQENAYELSFADASVSHLILFDVWHHLRFPGLALREFRRVLVPSGRLILFEPAASWTGRFVYRFFHHEPLALNDVMTWEAPTDFSSAHVDYYAAQGNATRLFWWGEARGHLAGWQLFTVQPITCFEYFASGGFSGPQLAGGWLRPALRALDRITWHWPQAFACRLLVVLEKEFN